MPGQASPIRRLGRIRAGAEPRAGNPQRDGSAPLHGAKLHPALHRRGMDRPDAGALASDAMITTTTQRGTGLTPRQREVVALIAAGCSNDEVGERLGISPRTAKAHSDTLRSKLGVSRRRQIPVAFRVLTGEDPLSASLGRAPSAAGGLTAGRPRQHPAAPRAPTFTMDGSCCSLPGQRHGRAPEASTAAASHHRAPEADPGARSFAGARAHAGRRCRLREDDAGRAVGGTATAASRGCARGARRRMWRSWRGRWRRPAPRSCPAATAGYASA